MARASFWQRFARLNAPLIARFLREVADEVEALFPGSPAIAFVYFNVGGSMSLNPTVLDTQVPFSGRLAWYDADGNPTTPAADEPVSVASDNPNVATVADNGDGTITVTIAGAGGLGAAVISASVTNESGDAVTAQGTITVVASDVTTGTIDFDVPDAPPAPTPPAPPAP